MSVRKFENKKGVVFETRFTYSDQYNRKKYYSKRGFTSEKKAKDHEKIMKFKLEQQIITDSKKTFEAVFIEAMDNSTLKLNTIGHYKQYYKSYLKKDLGNVSIDKIDYKLLQSILKKLGDTKTKDICSAASKVIKSVFNYAYNSAYITRIPYVKLGISGKRNDKKKKKIIEENEFLELLDNTIDEALKIVFYIAWYTGCRLGEILALEKNDIDFDSNTISINKTMFFDEDKKEIGISTPKTESSSSEVPMPDKLRDILTEWFKINKSNLVVFHNDSYMPLSYVKNYLNRYSKKHTKINMHMFRHTYTTKLYYNGLTEKEAQTLLRHKNFNTTLTTYTHLKEDKLKSKVDKLFN